MIAWGFLESLPLLSRTCTSNPVTDTELADSRHNYYHLRRNQYK